MSVDWWFDVVLIVVLAFMLYTMFRLYQLTSRPLEGGADPEDVFEDEKPIYNLYPKKLIRQTGYMPQDVFGLYWLGKLVLAILLPLTLLELMNSRLPVSAFVGVGVLGFFSVDLWLLRQRRKRRFKIERSISYLIDLIVAFLRAGMNLSDAFRQAGRYGLPKRNPLAREVDLVARELDAGRDRRSAFAGLALRTGVDDLHRLATVLDVGYRVGSAISDTLEVQSDLMRAKQWEKLAALVNRKSLESMMPLLLVSLPLFLVLVFFPAGVLLQETFSLFSTGFLR